MTKTVSKARKPAATKRTTAKKAVGATKTRKVTSLASKKRPVVKKKGLVHHAKHLYRITPKFVHGMVVGAIVGIMIVVPLGKSGDAGALTISSAQDCDSWSIVNCGVGSTGKIKKVYDGSAYVRRVYSNFGISSGDISTIGAKAVKGTLYANGDIKVGGKLVATDAVTAARKRVTSKDVAVTVNGSTFYKRHITAGWSHTSGPVYVVFDANGIFDYAIIASCGNPVTAKPKIPPAELACNSLTYSLVNKDNREYEFKAAASAKNTVITSYVFHFGDGQKQIVSTGASTATTKHSYAANGKTYSAYVVVNSSRKSGVTSTKCKVNLTTSQLPPILSCDGLSASPVDGKKNTFRFAARATATRTTITSYIFDFGDGKSATVTTSANSAFVERSFDANLVRTVTVSVNSKDFKNVTSPACKTSITTHTDECKPGVPVGSPQCEEKPTIKLTNVKELPNTGAGALLTVFMMSMVGGYAFHMAHRHIRHKRRHL